MCNRCPNGHLLYFIILLISLIEGTPLLYAKLIQNKATIKVLIDSLFIYSLIKTKMKTIKMFLILLLITVVVIITKVTSIHTCIDLLHEMCDGICECDGMECIIH